MATGRTLNRYSRVYVSGYDLSGYARSIGPLDLTFQEGVDDPINADYIGTHLGQGTISPGTLNAIFDSTATTGIHALLQTPGDKNVMVAQGIRAAPAQGDPVFCAQVAQTGYTLGAQETPTTVTVPFSRTRGNATSLLYAQPWGWLLHANTAVTGVNGSTGVDLVTTSTALGGYMMYQVTTAAGAGDITATIKVQDSDTNVSGDFDDLLTSGVINCGSSGAAVPTSGVVALGKTATVRQFVRWQIVLGTATSVTFTLAFVRNFIE